MVNANCKLTQPPTKWNFDLRHPDEGLLVRYTKRATQIRTIRTMVETLKAEIF